MSNQPELIYWKRQGVSETINAAFGHCRCDNTVPRWFVEIAPHLGRYSVVVDVAFPSCSRCYASRSGQSAFHREIKTTNAPQLWSVREEYERILREEVPYVGGPQVDFHPGVQAYMYYDAPTLAAYPRIKDDYYLASAFYYESQNAICRPDGRPLVENVSTNEEECVFHITARQEHTVLFDSLRDWRQPHHQPPRMSPRDGHGWLAWCISEKLNGLPGARPTIATSLFRD